jgi:hypothetical protein
MTSHARSRLRGRVPATLSHSTRTQSVSRHVQWIRVSAVSPAEPTRPGSPPKMTKYCRKRWTDGFKTSQLFQQACGVGRSPCEGEPARGTVAIKSVRKPRSIIAPLPVVIWRGQPPVLRLGESLKNGTFDPSSAPRLDSKLIYDHACHRRGKHWIRPTSVGCSGGRSLHKWLGRCGQGTLQGTL